MRQDKLTTKFQQALAEAQSLALSNDNQYIEPEHILAAIMDDEEGVANGLFERAGANAKQIREAVTDKTLRFVYLVGSLFAGVNGWFARSF